MLYCYAEPTVDALGRNLAWTGTDTGIKYPNPNGGELSFRYKDLIENYNMISIDDTKGRIETVYDIATNIYFEDNTCTPTLIFPREEFNKNILLLTVNIKDKIIHWVNNANVMILKVMTTSDTLSMVVGFPEKNPGKLSIVLRSTNPDDIGYKIISFDSTVWESNNKELIVNVPEITTGELNDANIIAITDKYKDMVTKNPRQAQREMGEYAFLLFGGEDKKTGRPYKYKPRKFRPSAPTKLILCHKRDFHSMGAEYNNIDTNHNIVIFSTLEELRHEIIRLKAEGYEAATLYMDIPWLDDEGFTLYRNNFNIIKETFGICNVLFNSGKIYKVYNR